LYASPEQIQSDKLDCRTDIYSLGMVLYECFCGEKAFPQKALPELIDRKMTGRFIDIRQLVHGIPEEFAQIIDSSTMLQRDRRFPDEKALIAALDAVIARHSSLSSAQIVENYITRQEAVEIAAASDAVKKPSGSRFLFLYLLAACAIIIAMAGIVWFTDRSNTAKRAKTADGPHYDQPVRRTATPAVSQAPDPVAPAARQQPRSGARPVRTDLLQEGMRAFSAGDYALAAGCLEQADTTVLDQRMRRIVRLRLIESYLGSGGTGKAGALAAAGPLDDGYFHLLKGRMHLESGRLDMAEESLVAAQTTRSVMGPVTRRDAVFYWARTIYERYRRKPNSENKTRAFTAWTNFQQAFCGVSADERQCAEAAERIAALSR